MRTVRAALRWSYAVSAVIAGMSLGLVGCTADGSSPEETALVEAVEHEFADEERIAAVAVVDGDDVRAAYVNASEATAFEIASISKALTGELLAEAVERGEVALDDPLGEYLSLGDAPAAAATLGQLATHTSGLPRNFTDPALIAELDEAIASGSEPADMTVDELVDVAKRESVFPGSSTEYSNLGAALLGHALATAADTDYPTLLRERLFDPLGMDGASAPVTTAELPDELARGYTASGTEAVAWADAAWAPASGVYATLDDLIALSRAVIDGPLSKSAALKIIERGPRHWDGIGYLWLHDEVGGRSLVGHDGVGSGSSSALLIDRNAGQAVIVLLNESGEEAMRIALRRLEELAESSD